MAKDFARKFYNSKAWKQCREGYIESVNGLCERCLARGKMRPGKILHHIKYLTPTNINDPYVTLNWDNLEYLCQECHNEEHHAESYLADGLIFTSDGQIAPIKNKKSVE